MKQDASLWQCVPSEKNKIKKIKNWDIWHSPSLFRILLSKSSPTAQAAVSLQEWECVYSPGAHHAQWLIRKSHMHIYTNNSVLTSKSSCRLMGSKETKKGKKRKKEESVQLSWWLKSVLPPSGPQNFLRSI